MVVNKNHGFEVLLNLLPKIFNSTKGWNDPNFVNLMDTILEHNLFYSSITLSIYKVMGYKKTLDSPEGKKWWDKYLTYLTNQTGIVLIPNNSDFSTKTFKEHPEGKKY